MQRGCWTTGINWQQKWQSWRQGPAMLLSNFPGLTLAINSGVCWVCSTTTALTMGKDWVNSPLEERMVKLHVLVRGRTSAKEPLWKKPFCSSYVLTRSFFVWPNSIHAIIIHFWKGLINIEWYTPVTEQEHLHRELLQKWPFHFIFTLEYEKHF